MDLEPQNVRGPAGPAPQRPANSVRRTSTVDMTWPEGLGTQLRLSGRARDAVTRSPGEAPVVVATASTEVGIGANRVVDSISSIPERAGIEGLIGSRGGGYLRAALEEVLPGERASGSPLYLLLDDISGTSLIAGFAWSRWSTDWARPPAGAVRPSMEGVCIGFRPGSSALVEIGGKRPEHRIQPVASLVHDDDQHGWHELADLPPVSMRRARRIDVWIEGDTIVIDSAFQDSAGDPDGRVAIHEYALRATADRTTMTLRTIDADARILPYLECPSAMATAQVLVGSPLAELRTTVLERLARTQGCTHLNDALRALAEVPVLLSHLESSAHA